MTDSRDFRIYEIMNRLPDDYTLDVPYIMEPFTQSINK